MANFTITTTSTVGRTLEEGEVGIVANGAVLAVSGTTSALAVTLNGSATLIVDGIIAASFGAVLSFRDLNLSVGQNGSLTGFGPEFGVGILFGGSGERTITNAGTISGTNGIDQNSIQTLVNGEVPTTSYSLTNSGTISGTAGNGVRLNSLNGDITVENSGSITGTDDGIDLFAISGSTVPIEYTVINSGVIRGGDEAIRLGGADTMVIVNTGEIIGTAAITVNSGPARVRNSGEISGTVSLRDGDDVLSNSGSMMGDIETGLGEDLVINSGLILGDLSLGDDDDLYRGLVDGVVVGLVDGGVGNDRIIGASQDDEFIGGANNDTLSGGGGDDTLDGGANNDFLSGGDGIDVLLGGSGNDTIVGGAGGDQIVGDSGRDRLSGNEGDDTIFGGSASDTMFGGEGDDEITGGIGIDTMNGGAGEDTFIFEEGDFGAGASRDRIIGFDAGEDVVDLSGQGLQFGGTSAIGGGQASVWVFETPFGSTLLRVDFDGNGSVDGVILLSGTTGVTDGDIVL